MWRHVWTCHGRPPHALKAVDYRQMKTVGKYAKYSINDIMLCQYKICLFVWGYPWLYHLTYIGAPYRCPMIKAQDMVR